MSLPLLKFFQVMQTVSTYLYSIRSSTNNPAVYSGDINSGRSLTSRRNNRGRKRATRCLEAFLTRLELMLR